MNARDLLKLPRETIVDISILKGCYYCHVPEIADLWPSDWYGYGCCPDSAFSSTARVRIGFVKLQHTDARRFWALGVVLFDDKPVMIIQNAGREGDDHAKRFLLDPGTYRDMLCYLAGAFAALKTSKTCSSLEVKRDDLLGMDEDRADLTDFYGNNLETVGPDLNWTDNPGGSDVADERGR